MKLFMKEILKIILLYFLMMFCIFSVLSIFIIFKIHFSSMRILCILTTLFFWIWTLILGVQISSVRFQNLDCLKRWEIFSRWNSKIAWEMGKNRNQRWTILWLSCSFILLWNKCIFDKKRRTELIYTPNSIKKKSIKICFIHC